MTEIIYLSDFYETAELFLQELTEELQSRGIAYKVNRQHMFLETDNYRVIALSIHSGQLGRSHHLVKFFVDGLQYGGENVGRRYEVFVATLREGTKEITYSELLRILGARGEE